jgi:hypothetical protein
LNAISGRIFFQTPRQKFGQVPHVVLKIQTNKLRFRPQIKFGASEFSLPTNFYGYVVQWAKRSVIISRDPPYNPKSADFEIWESTKERCPDPVLKILGT